MRIWHPEVHRAFHEFLYYYVLSVRPYARLEFAEHLRSFLEAQRLAGCCYYEVFGDCDVLMRIWLPVGMEGSFAEELQRHVGNVQCTKPFKLSAFRRYWCMKEKLFAFKREALDHLTSNAVRDVQREQADVALVQSCQNSGLLADIEKSSNVKFFVSISSPFGTAGAAEELLQDFVGEIIDIHVASGRLVNPSLYVGEGLAWVLAKAEVRESDFFAIAPFVNDVSMRLSDFGCFTTTYVACTAYNYESDDISERSLTQAQR